MQRVVCVHLPMWSIDRIRRRDTKQRDKHAGTRAALVVATTAGREHVVQCCGRARSAGVLTGMTVAHARALLTDCDIRMIPHEPQRDAAALQALAAWMIRFAPLVAPDPPDSVTLDVTGCDRLYHGERRLVNMIANRLSLLGVTARVACADTVGCAWALAHYGQHDRCIIDTAMQQDALAPLPVEALRLDEDSAAGLREIGIECIGDVLALPRLELAARFDSDLLLRLDQAMGEAIETIDPIRRVDAPVVETCFAGPVRDLEAIQQTARDMIDRLAGELHRREVGARSIVLRFTRIDAMPIRQHITLSHPSRSAAHLWSLLKPQIEKLHLGYGIERIEMTAHATARLPHEQYEHNGAADAQHADTAAGCIRAFGELADTLHQRLGAHSVMQAQPMATHVPERSIVHKPLATNGRAEALCDRNACISRDQPSMLLASPARVRVIAMSPDGPITWLRWRGHDHRIITSIGPQRIASEWWRRTGQHDDASTERDYFKVQDETGRWLWVFREQPAGRWFVHGEWA